MNIIEAIKSGKPFRRQGHAHWMQTSGDYVRVHEPDGPSMVEFDRRDLLADDWEISEPTVTITAKKFWDAWAKVLKQEDARRALLMGPLVIDLMAILAKELGL